MSQEQSHGFCWENDIRMKVFGLQLESNNTDKHDIPANINKFNNNENISIKTTGTNTICMGDILRIYNKDENYEHTMIVLKYKQIGNKKKIARIYEYNFNTQMYDHLFGKNWCKEEQDLLHKYVLKVKSIPKKVARSEIREYYNYSNGDDINKLRSIIKNKGGHITINPKVDTKSQRRVQCSIGNFTKVLERFKTYASPIANVNMIRGSLIINEIDSAPRIKSMLYTKEQLLTICRGNKDNVSGYSNKSKLELLKLLKNKNLIAK